MQYLRDGCLECALCSEVKPISEFNRNNSKKRGYAYACKSCYSLYGGNHATRLRKYRITNQQYQQMRESQQDCCLICEKHESEVRAKKRVFGLYVDHDHVSGKVRGLLCSNCNLLVGWMEKQHLVLDNAISYVQKHAESKAA